MYYYNTVIQDVICMIPVSNGVVFLIAAITFQNICHTIHHFLIRLLNLE